MHRMPMPAAVLLGAALLSPGGATAAEETCHGEAASLVGEPGGFVHGTPGRDVVVTNGASSVRTFEGDDLICITGRDHADGTQHVVTLDAGDGDDVVDGTAADSWPVDGMLGAGADVFAGGAGDDNVDSGGLYGDSGEVDIIRTGDGDDSVLSGNGSVTTADIIDLGGGNDSLSWGAASLAPGGSIDGGTHSGAGVDQIHLPMGTDHSIIDNVAHTLRRDGTLVASWTGIEGFFLTGPRNFPPVAVDVNFTGSDLDEELTILAGTGTAVRATADLGGGDDTLVLWHLPDVGSRFEGGSGRDVVNAGTTSGGLKLDLRRGELSAGRSTPTLPVTGFRDAYLIGRRVQVIGDRHGNRLSGHGCRVRLDGKEGHDQLREFRAWRSYHFRQIKFDCTPRTLMFGRRGEDTLRGGRGLDRLFGGPGLDRLKGRKGTDLLLGGRGLDRADGGPGNDRCAAERKRRCER